MQPSLECSIRTFRLAKLVNDYPYLIGSFSSGFCPEINGFALNSEFQDFILTFLNTNISIEEILVLIVEGKE